MKVSDKTLVILMFVAIVITIGSIGMIVFKVGGVGGITGFVTQNESIGYVNISIVSSIAVTLTTDTIDFGNGTLDLTGITYLNASEGVNEGGGFDEPGPFHLRNDGNVYANVTVNGSTPAEFYGADYSLANYTYAIEDDGDEVLGDTCFDVHEGPGENNSTFAQANISGGYGITMSNAFTTVCPNMSYVDANDEFNVTIYLNINLSIVEKIIGDVLVFKITSNGHS